MSLHQFDSIADSYATEEFPVKTYVEEPSFFRVLGNIDGAAVLDLGCGNGLYTRELKARTGERVVGVDVAAEMIGVAIDIETTTPRGVEYLVADATDLPELGCFDIVTAAHLLHYAPDTDRLSAMIAGAARSLRPGGRLVALIHNPDFDDNGPPTRQYGYVVTMPASRTDGAEISLDILAGPDLPTRGEEFTIRFHYYHRNTYDTLLRAAGFREISWHRFDVADSLPTDRPAPFWQNVVANPYSDIVSCHL
ncbi:class I SAM-dependent methyltransferase [Nocardia sp. 2YAB30]|uniref:class I SAM-dependent methyltransferase n=1 Tax=Nocardia sp. 2YAB30 TaxID=3233022 RepID=UPI003F97CAD0